MSAETLSLELWLDPEDAGAVGRLRVLAGLRRGRARASVSRAVWHDGASAPVAAAGMSLGLMGPAGRGVWRLERLVPGDPPSDAAWPPGGLAPVVAEGDVPPTDRWDHPPTLMPWAAFEGRLLTYDLGGAADGVSLSVLDGTARTVASERRLCRLRLSGPAEAVASMALAVAGEIRVAVPAASLAGEALAMARDRPVVARRLGAPELSPTVTVAEAFAHVVGHLADVIVAWAGRLAEGEPHVVDPEPVHQMRVATRRLRSVLGLFRRACGGVRFDAAAEGARDLGRVLGPARDWDVFIDGAGAAAGAAFPEEPAVARLLAAAARRRRAGYAALAAHLDGPAFRRFGVTLALLAAGMTEPADPEDEAAEQRRSMTLAEFAARGLDRRYRAMVGETVSMEGLPVEALHDIRLAGKRLRYACEIFAPLFPGKAARRFVRRLTVLQEALGALNDGAVAGALMTELSGSAGERGFAAGIVLGMVAGGGGASRTRIERAWGRFRRLEPFWA